MRRSIALFAILVLFFAACGNDDDTDDQAAPEATAPAEAPAPATTPEPADDTPTVEEPEVEEPEVEEPEPTPVPEVEITPIPVSTAEPPERPVPDDTSNPAFSSSDKLSTVGIGNLFFGMDPDAAAEAIPTAWTGGQGDGTPRCYLLAPANGPDGVVVTVYNSSIERVDITNPGITTRSGASVGSTEAQLHELFDPQLVVTPYEDGSGNSIQFVPVDEADVDYRVIWETDGTSVTSMRAGRLPAVAPREPCT